MTKESPTLSKEIQQNLAVTSIKFMRSAIQSKIAKHIKKQKNIIHNQEKLEMYPEIIKIDRIIR